MIRPYDAVLFDLDGTLSDSVDLILRSYRHTMKTHLGKELPDALWLQGVGTPLEIQLSEFARSPDEIRTMRKTFAQYYVQRHDSEVDMFPGAMQGLNDLKGQGIKLGLVTAKSRIGANRTLRRHHLIDFFDVVVTSDDTKEGKPHPQPVLFALASLNVRPERACFVGDSTHDINAGNAAGVDSIAVVWGPYPREVLAQCRPKKWLMTTADIIKLGQPS